VRTITFGEHEVTLRETDYVEGGLGWRVWASVGPLTATPDCLRKVAEDAVSVYRDTGMP
jgi:hypothetical protein